MFTLSIRLLALGSAVALAGCGGEDGPQWRSYRIESGSVVREAIAVGRVEPRVEVPVKSAWGGVVTQRFVKLGDRVSAQDPLLEVRPQLTDRDRLRARRGLVGAAEGYETAREISEGENLAGRAMRLLQGAASLDRMRAQAERGQTDAALQVKLLLEGEAEIDGLVLDWVIRSPIDGVVVRLPVETGQPVVPSSSYGSGTPLVTVADIDKPIFRGTIDELDAGRLKAGMTARIDLGALPGVDVRGTLREISLLASTRNGATVFDVLLDVEAPAGTVMRAGYSAVARITIEEAMDVPIIPERLLDYRADGAFVRVAGPGGEPTWLRVEIGVSDGLRAAVLSGLVVGDEVLEPAD